MSAWSGGGWVSQHALRQTPLAPPVDRQTLVKILPWPNFIAAGKNYTFLLKCYPMGDSYLAVFEFEFPNCV